ncbi:hypothetical protein Tco_1107887 [Tanacetum coccineum]
MINHTQAEPIGILTNVLCEVGVTTIIAKFLILDIPIDRDAPIVVGRGFLYTIGGIVNIPERLFSTFDGICHQTFCAARSDVLRTAESDSDDEEEYEIKRNKFGAPMYGPKPAAYLNCNDPAERSLALQAVINPFRKISVWKKAVSFLGSLPVPLQHVNWKPDYNGCYTNEEEAKGQWRTEIRTMGGNDDEAGSSRTKRFRQFKIVEEVLLPQVHHEFLLWEGCNRDVKSRMGCDGEIDDMLRIKLREAESNEEIFTSMAWIRAFNINEPIYSELCHEFYSTYEFDKVCADDEFQTKKIIKFRLGGRAHSLTLLEFARRLGLYHADELDEDGFVLRVIHKMITYGLSKRTTEYDKIQKNDLWLLSMFDARHQNGYADVAWLIARSIKRKGVASGSIGSQICDLRTECASHELATMPAIDLYERMGSMEICQGAIERMSYRQPYHWDRYAGVFEHMAEVYSVSLQGAYNPPRYAQPQYDQYYQQYPPQPSQQQQQDDDE